MIPTPSIGHAPSTVVVPGTTRHHDALPAFMTPDWALTPTRLLGVAARLNETLWRWTWALFDTDPFGSDTTSDDGWLDDDEDDDSDDLWASDDDDPWQDDDEEDEDEEEEEDDVNDDLYVRASWMLGRFD